MESNLACWGLTSTRGSACHETVVGGGGCRQSALKWFPSSLTARAGRSEEIVWARLLWGTKIPNSYRHYGPKAEIVDTGWAGKEEDGGPDLAFG